MGPKCHFDNLNKTVFDDVFERCFQLAGGAAGAIVDPDTNYSAFCGDKLNSLDKISGAETPKPGLDQILGALGGLAGFKRVRGCSGKGIGIDE